MIKLLFGLDGGNRRRGERSPGSLKLRVELLKLRRRRRETFNLKALKITKFFGKPWGGLKMCQGQRGKPDQDWTMVREAHPEPVGACGVVEKAPGGAVVEDMVNFRATSELSGRPGDAALVGR